MPIARSRFARALCACCLVPVFLAAPAARAAAPEDSSSARTIVVGGSNGRVVGSGRLVDQPRAVAGFHAVRVSGPIDVLIQQGERESVSVQADDNLQALIDTTVRDGMLDIGLNKGAVFRTESKLVAQVRVQSLDQLVVTGSGDVRIAHLKTGEFKVSIVGSSNVSVDRLEAEIVAVSIKGSGDFRAAGRAPTQGYSIAGSGDVRAADLVGEQVAIKIAGSGNGQVHARGALSVSISGSGDVRYRGQPQLAQTISGRGEVTPLD